MKHVDLHLHTLYSDGFYTPKRVVIDSVMQGQEVIAITDHDITTGVKEAMDEAKKWGIKVIPGVEISTSPYHILGYGIDLNDKGFQNLLAKSRFYQEEITRKRVDIIKNTGIPITFEKIKQTYPRARIGKVNLATTMMFDSECQKHFIGKSLNELMNIYLRNGGIADEVGEKVEITPKEAIEGIHKAGGLAVLAHPFKEIKDMKELDVLLSYGLDGIEIQPNYKARNDPFIEYAQKNGLLLTYGSDFHGAVFPNRPLLSRNGNKLDLKDINRLERYLG